MDVVDISPGVELPDVVGQDVLAVKEADLPYLLPIQMPAVARHSGKRRLAGQLGWPAEHDAIPNARPRTAADERSTDPPGDPLGRDGL